MSDGDDTTIGTDGYEVGYGKPPKEHRIQKGEVRNPRGRPKKASDIGTLINLELDRIIGIKEGGRDLRVRKREALARRLVNAALNGNIRAIEYLVQYCEKHGAGDPFVITQADRDAFAADMHRRLPAEPQVQEDDPGSEDEGDSAGRT